MDLTGGLFGGYVGWMDAEAENFGEYLYVQVEAGYRLCPL